MTKSNIKAVIQGDIQRVWKIVTAVEDYTWRSDLSRTEILSEKQFIEYTRTGYATTFTVTVLEPCKRWEFEMENTNMKGRWIGVFTSVEEGTEIDFTECVTVKKFFLKPLIKAYLKKQQIQFVADLNKAVLQKKDALADEG